MEDGEGGGMGRVEGKDVECSGVLTTQTSSDHTFIIPMFPLLYFFSSS